MKYSIEQIAEVIHEANRVLQGHQGDPSMSQHWMNEPEDIRMNVMRGVQDVIRRHLTPEQLHQAWCRDKLDNGWQWGPEKDPERKTHPCLLAYNHLPSGQQDKNRLFIAIVRALT